MLAKAVAHHTTASFIRVVGSEFVQKYLGEVKILQCTSRHFDTKQQLTMCSSKMHVVSLNSCLS
jgi:ATP-dependent 26S proteasome regulatory subunit